MKHHEKFILEAAVVELEHFSGDFVDYFEGLVEHLLYICTSFVFVLDYRHPTFPSISQKPLLAVVSPFDYV